MCLADGIPLINNSYGTMVTLTPVCMQLHTFRKADSQQTDSTTTRSQSYPCMATHARAIVSNVSHKMKTEVCVCLYTQVISAWLVTGLLATGDF